MRTYDITVPISPQMPVWPGDPKVSLERLSSLSRGDRTNTSKLCLGTHTGTHIDPPYHLFENGYSVDKIPLEKLIGPAYVMEAHPQGRTIRATDLGGMGLPAGVTRLLLKTENSYLWQGALGFERDFIHLDKSAARWVVDRGIRLLGVDYLSVDAFGTPDMAAHRILLEAGVIIVEGLDLAQVTPGVYQLCCLPLRIAGGDGAPARAVLIKT